MIAADAAGGSVEPQAAGWQKPRQTTKGDYASLTELAQKVDQRKIGTSIISQVGKGGLPPQL